MNTDHRPLLLAGVKSHLLRGRALATTALSFALLAFAVPANAKLSWGDVGTECRGTQRVDYARLYGLSWPQDGDWIATCNATRAAGINARSNGKYPSICRQGAANAIWAEWRYSNHKSCKTSLVWTDVKESCTGDEVQTVSAKLDGIPWGKSWEDYCNATDAGGDVSLKGVSGKPDRCISTATGVYGEWDKQNVAQCAAHHEWGAFKDEGCVSDLSGATASGTGVTGEGYRAWSSVLWGIQGDWMEACRIEPVHVTLPNGQRVDMDYPTACAIAEADEALSWVAGAVLGAGTAFIASPTGPYAIAASGAAISVATQGVGEGLKAIDTGLNVWGIVWVEDPTCGDVNRDNFPQATAIGTPPPRAPASLPACPPNATRVNGELTCMCQSDQLEAGTVWGTNTYTNDSSICKAALHSGRIDRSGGAVRLRIQPGQRSYSGSTRNGVTSASYGRWDKSFTFE